MGEKQYKKSMLLPVTIGVCIVSLIVMMFALLFSKGTKQGEFSPPPFEEAAVTGIPVVPENLNWGEMDAQVFKASVCANLILENKRADIWLTNPASNRVWIKLRIVDANDNILGETGLIKPGEYVQKVEFTTIPQKGADIRMKIMSYEPETYYSAGSVTVNTKLGDSFICTNFVGGKVEQGNK